MADGYALANPQMIGAANVGQAMSFFGTPPTPYLFYDVGGGRIVGTVKEKNAPSNTPLKRRVVLLVMPGSRAIRETWSDPITGVYEFNEVELNRVYTVLSYDHTGTYRAVVADNLTPEVMP